MQPLIDADVLLYEIGFAAETAWNAAHKERGEEPNGPPPFEKAQELLDNRIGNICAIVEATKPPILFLTGKTNFRNEIAKTQKYKDRPSNKPFHYHNLKAYIKGKYDYRLTEGLEADDLMAIEQTARQQETIICTRDKDLRSVSGWHYGWELGHQPQFGPLQVSYLGSIQLSNKRNKIQGTGILFFFSQLLTGDDVDSIPGLPKYGPVKTYEILKDAKDEKAALRAVFAEYKKVYGILAYSKMLEQGRLLWMTRKLREDGTPILWGQTK